MTPSAAIRSSALSNARAILQKQIAAALACLEGRVISDSHIHSSRKKLKQARASLRLIRDELPGETFRSENLALRDRQPMHWAADRTAIGAWLHEDEIAVEQLYQLPGQTPHQRRQALAVSHGSEYEHIVSVGRERHESASMSSGTYG